MKKIGAMALALILMAVLLLAGCQNKQPDDKTDPSDKLGQMLQVSSTVFKKLEGGYHEYLEASKAYGKLVPYIGRRSMLSMGDGVHVDQEWWGFCTTDGLVVTDAVYSSIEWTETEAGNGVYVMTRIDEDDPMKSHAWMAADDGKWVVDLGENGYMVDCGNSRILTSTTRQASVSYTIYDYYGKQITVIEPMTGEEMYMSGFSGGYAFVERFVGGDYTETTPYGYYINRNGKEVFPYSFMAGQDFENGMAVVRATDGFYGIVRDNGTWFVEPSYFDITRYGNYFVLNDNYDCAVIDSTGKEVARFIETGNVWLTVGKEVLYRTTDDSTLRYLTTGEPVINSKTGDEVQDDSWTTDTLVSQYDASKHRLYVMDYYGTVKYTVDDYESTYECDGKFLAVHCHSNYEKYNWMDIKTGELILTTTDQLYESARTGWYYRATRHSNATLYQMSTGEQIKFPSDHLVVQTVDGKLYYQLYNETQMILMNADMDVLIKLSNKK